MTLSIAHHYIERSSGAVRREQLFADQVVRFLYHPLRERAPALFGMLTGARSSALLAFFNYDLALAAKVAGNRRFLRECGVDLTECLDPPESLDTARKVFERRIRYWECRPLPQDPAAIVSPADARVIVGSFAETAALYLRRSSSASRSSSARARRGGRRSSPAATSRFFASPRTSTTTTTFRSPARWSISTSSTAPSTPATRRRW